MNEAMSLDGRDLVLGRDVLSSGGDLNVLLGKVHLSREGAVRLPLVGGTGSALLEHLVDLLESKTLCLRDEEVGEEEGDAAKTTPHEEHVGAELGRVGTVGNKVGGNDTDDAVPEPVGRGRDTNTTRADGEREDLADNNPSAWTPGRSEDGDVQADEGDHGLGGIGVGRVVDSVLTGGSTNGTDDKLHNDHTCSTKDQKPATSYLLNQEERGWSGEHVDEGGDESDEEGVFDRTELREEYRALREVSKSSS